MDEHTLAARAADLCTVLIVDASAALLQTLRSVLRTSVCRCVTAGDSLEALCAIVEYRPAVVIIDADTGPLPPWQLFMLVGEHPDFCDTRMILSCSRDDAVERARATAIGAEQFLPKPFSAEEVLALLAVSAPEVTA